MANNSIKYVSLTRLSNFLDNIKAKYAQLGHTHKMSDLTDYTVDNALSSTSTNPVQNKIINAEFDAVSQAMSALELSIDGKAASSHTHDDRYYTESEINTKLEGKANISHTHTKADVGLGNVENKSSATIRSELTKENVVEALGYEPPSTSVTYTAITNEEVDEICSSTISMFLDSIASEGVSF